MPKHLKKPVFTRRSVLVGSAAAVLGNAIAQTAGVALPAAVEASLPKLTLAGRARLTVWGFRVYDAQLWVAAGFARSKPTASAFVLDLTYLRDLKAADIAERSVVEMRRQAELAEADEKAWRSFMLATFKNVGNGDRLLGIHQPGQPTRFTFNGAEIGRISDDRFDERFFDIWLGAKSSEPAMRDALLAGAPP